MQQTAFDNIFNIIGGLSEGNEKPMKHGFYNAFALFVLAICCVAVYVLFLILEPFFKPLFWALLVGSLLHPFKYKLSKKIKTWFEDLEKRNSSVISGLMFIPVNVVNYASDTVGYQFREHYKTLTIALAYIISVYTLWSPNRAGIFQVTSHILWLVVVSFLASLAGTYKVYMFVLLQVFCVIGFVLEVLHVHKDLVNKDPDVSIMTAIQVVLTNKPHVNRTVEELKEKADSAIPEVDSEIDSTSDDSPSAMSPENAMKTGSWADNETIQNNPRHAKILFKTRTLSELPLNPKMKSSFDNRLLASFKQRSLDEHYIKNNFTDDETALYFKLLFFACFCMLVWKYIWLLPIMESALFPAQIRGIRKMLSICNSSVIEMAYESIDTVSSCIVIIGLILFLTVATVFICIQIYSEAIVVIQLSGSLLNSTFVQNSALHAYLPEGWEEKLDSLIDNAYTYGREGISTGLKRVMKEGDPENIARVEQQVLELWDRVYQSWVSAGGIWAPLASNVSLLAGSLGAFTSILFSGGGAIINMIINLVFRASFKMALFYGLWTWLVHNFFGAKVVYLPSGPYLAGIPAALDVWLQGRPMAAVMLPIAQAAPIAFLDAAVYAEIKDGGHPYVTGLAIAGGIFYLGPEGAILGPLLLCCLMVVLNLSSSFLRDTPAEERAALHSRVRLGAFI
ncbi:unnamed protein product [Leptidea sinapis]|uniref:Transmembrane protein 245 n=1 Tax=Leptidea sinapis TaxID=189913 RepID=A0A5E4Q0L1_9NEOP|nr:unnamed protein product [Leptidea sinapis]